MRGFRRDWGRAQTACWLSLFSVLFFHVSGAEKSSVGEEGILWAQNFEMALEEASVRDRIVMVDFWTSWCHWCHVLDRETYADPTVIRLSRRLVCVKVNAELRDDLARHYRIRSYPSIVFLRSDGSLIDLVLGFQRPTEFAESIEDLTDSRAEEFILRQRLRDHPDLIAVRHDLALLLLSREAAEEAAAQFDTLWALTAGLPDKDRRDLILDRGRALHLAGRNEEATEVLERFVAHERDATRLSQATYCLGEAALARAKAKPGTQVVPQSLGASFAGVAGRAGKNAVGRSRVTRAEKSIPDPMGT